MDIWNKYKTDDTNSFSMTRNDLSEKNKIKKFANFIHLNILSFDKAKGGMVLYKNLPRKARMCLPIIPQNTHEYPSGVFFRISTFQALGHLSFYFYLYETD